MTIQSSRDCRITEMVGTSTALQTVFAAVQRVAPTDSTVLILGETGTGKELVARAIHQTSARQGRAFIKLNCAAIPFDLLESELFGHEKGAFTGAIAQKIGRFELADRGTLFLDEIGDIPPALQPKLLRVLQEQEFERLGSGRTHHVSVRLIAATHRDLTAMVQRNEFRSDLYYRLNVFPVVVPPLRDRREDIPPLVAHFVELFARRMGKHIEHIPPQTLSALLSQAWPGNVRELQNVIERAVICANDGVLGDVLVGSNQRAPIPITDAASAHPRGQFWTVERTLILRELEAAGWVVGGADGAAERLGLKRTTLLGKMKKLGIARPVRRRAPVDPAPEHTEAWLTRMPPSHLSR